MRYMAILGAATALAMTSPAYAAGHGYVGFDAGLLMPDDSDFKYDSDTGLTVDYKNGYDLDIIGGYDFGFIRAEGELGWKHANHDEYQGLNINDGDISVNADGDVNVLSGMINVLGDVGTDKFSFYAGGGIGLASVKNRIEVGSEHENFKDSGFAYQLIAGVRYSMNEMIDIGLKYRYFDTAELSEDGSITTSRRIRPPCSKT